MACPVLCFAWVCVFEHRVFLVTEILLYIVGVLVIVVTFVRLLSQSFVSSLLYPTDETPLSLDGHARIEHREAVELLSLYKYEHTLQFSSNSRPGWTLSVTTARARAVSIFIFYFVSCLIFASFPCYLPLGFSPQS